MNETNQTVQPPPRRQGSSGCARLAISGVELAFAAGAVGTYLLSVIFQEHLLVLVFGLPLELPRSFLAQRGQQLFLANLALRLPAATCALGAVVTAPSESWTRLGLRQRPRTLGATILATVLLVWLLNALDLWPYGWRWPSSATLPFTQVLLRAGRASALALWALQVVVVTPVLEELIFRNWMPRAIALASGSEWLAISLSAACFALAHIGRQISWPLPLDYMVNMSWLFLAAILLGWIALKRRGGLAVAIAAHATKNLMELLFAMLAAAR